LIVNLKSIFPFLLDISWIWKKCCSISNWRLQCLCFCIWTNRFWEVTHHDGDWRWHGAHSTYMSGNM